MVMKNIIKKLLKEEVSDKIIKLAIERLKSDRIKKPYFSNLHELGLTEEEIGKSLEHFLSGKFEKSGIYSLLTRGGNLIYLEAYDSYWEFRDYDDRGNEIFYEDSNGIIIRREFDEKNKIIKYDSNF